MRKSSIFLKRKVIIVGILVLAFAMMGGAYAAWSDSTTVKGNFSSGIFNMIFGDQDFRVDVVNKHGKVLAELQGEIAAEMMQDGKELKLDFLNGLPKEVLKGNYIRIQGPVMKKAGSTFGNIQLQELNLQKADEMVEMQPVVQAVLIHGVEQDLGTIPESYSTPLKFRLYKEIARNGQTTENVEGDLQISFYLQLTETSIAFVKELQKTPLVVEAEPGDKKAKPGQKEETGILVNYSGSIPFYLDQNQPNK